MTHNPRLCFPILPQCSTYFTVHNRCRDTSTVMLYAPDQPDDKPVPGGYLCADCAKRITDEYREKLKEEWPLKPIHQYDPTSCAGVPA